MRITRVAAVVLLLVFPGSASVDTPGDSICLICGEPPGANHPEDHHPWPGSPPFQKRKNPCPDVIPRIVLGRFAKTPDPNFDITFEGEIPKDTPWAFAAIVRPQAGTRVRFRFCEGWGGTCGVPVGCTASGRGIREWFSSPREFSFQFDAALLPRPQACASGTNKAFLIVFTVESDDGGGSCLYTVQIRVP